MTVQTEQVVGLDLAGNVARRVRGLMAELQMNQADVARVLNVSRSGVSDRLNRTKDFDLKELPAIAELLGESVEYLLGLTDVRHEGLEPPTRWFDRQDLIVLPGGSQELATVLAFERPRGRILGGRPARPGSKTERDAS